MFRSIKVFTEKGSIIVFNINKENVPQRLWSQRAIDSQPYVAGEQPKDKQYIKLNTNENPYPPSPRALQAIAEAMGEDLKLYPDPEATRLKETIASHYGLQRENVFVGNGSDEVLAFSFLAFLNQGDKAIFPDITYSFYVVYANIFGVEAVKKPLDDNFQINLADYQGLRGAVLLANPNAPTGIALSRDKITQVLQANPLSLVLVDEAYVDFGGESAVPLINDYDNLLVVQTFSKSRSLAGLRVGFALGQRQLIEALERIKNSVNSYTLDRMAQAGAAAAMKDLDHFEQTRTQIIATRDKTAERLRELGFAVLPSKANFLFVCHPEFSGEYIFGRLREESILVRHFAKPRIKDYLRVTVGSEEEMERFQEVICRIIAAKR